MRAFLNYLIVATFLYSSCFGAYARNLIIGGHRVDREVFPEVVKFECLYGSDMAKGSAVVIGPRVVLAPRHMIIEKSECSVVSSNGRIPVTIEDLNIGTQPLESDFDLVAGLIATEDSFESKDAISVSEDPVVLDERLVLAGFGCIGMYPYQSSNNALYAGHAVVQATRDNSMTFITKGSALCTGDSGAPAIRLLDNGSRTLIGVGNKSDLNQESWFANVTHPDVLTALREFAESKGVEICGINIACN